MPSLLRLLLLLLASLPAFAQTIALGHGCALDVIDGTLTAIGDDYKATFRAGELEFTPLLGRQAPRNLPLALEVTHCSRGEPVAVGPAALSHDGLVATFGRPELDERLEVRTDGIKQSFVFASLPPGNGDLVVRCRVRSELRPQAIRSAGSLRFLHGSVGGVEIGAVLGLEADGKTCDGSLHCDGEHVDFVLPASFVQQARLPLVVDPLLSTIAVTSSTLADSAPDVAPLPAPVDAYLVVWQRAVSATDRDVRAQRVSSNGTLLGSLIMLETSSQDTADVSVAASPISGRWLVAWEQLGDIKGRILSSTGGPLSSLDFANGPNQQRSPTLAGGGFASSGIAMCVWHDATANQIQCKQVNLSTLSSSFPNSVVASGTSAITVSDPTISRDNRLDRALVVWRTTNLLGQRSLRGVVLTPNGTPLSPVVPIAGGGGIDASFPTCAGDGVDFVVSWLSASPVLGNGAACAAVHHDFVFQGLGPLTVGTPRPFQGPGGSVRSTATAMFQGSAMVALSSPGTTGNDVSTLSVDPLLCSDCEGSLPVDLAGNDVDVAICSRATGPAAITPNDGAVVYVPIVGGQGDVALRLLRADDGVRSLLEINCTPGLPFAPCARAGNQGFGVLLRGAEANELTLVIHSTALLNFNCQPCIIGPDPAVGVIEFLGATSANGDLRAALPLPGGPAVVGTTVHSQFVLFGGQCLGNFRGTLGISCTLQ
ncbi:MAG: hypothetical protein MUC36_00310 [Planctomycetes bacterium]|nr:hypothetical protein [Planctomycetota bacterium]